MVNEQGMTWEELNVKKQKSILFVKQLEKYDGETLQALQLIVTGMDIQKKLSDKLTLKKQTSSS